MSRITTFFSILLLINAITGCTTRLPETALSDTVPTILAAANRAGIYDSRARFREVLCAVNAKHGVALPDFRPCEEILTKVSHEPAGTGVNIDLGQSQTGLTAVFVPGVGWDCFDEWLEIDEHFAEHINEYNFNLKIMNIEGLSSSQRNAKLVRDGLLEIIKSSSQEKIVLIGYSKGIVDILEAIVRYPELHEHISAVVSIAGAVGGSPLAIDADKDYLKLLTKWPGANCTEGDSGVIDSLNPKIRQSWLYSNILPDSFPYFSLATLPEKKQISLALKPSYNRLSQLDSRNDGQLLYFDQLLPGSHLLGYLNADHWAVMVPIARSHEFLGATVTNKNSFPREVLIEAVLRMISETLDEKP
ncbi:MAG: hypothetical protein KJO69_08385 [Gammaproteobacteria bacterium]|nr:hypothetical protein [Gammaproteobacteria bacterium]